MGVGTLTRYGLPYSNVVASGVATNNITPGRTLEVLNLKLGGTTFTKAMISDIKIKANGKVIVQASGTQLDKINAYKGQAADVAYLDIPFTERSGLGEFDRAVGALDTAQLSSLTTEVTIAGATAPILTPILRESASQAVAGNGAFSGLMSKILQVPYNIATGGRLSANIAPVGANGAIVRRVYVFSNAGLMTGATVKQDGLVIHESLKLENEYEQKRWGRVPQTNVYVIDFMVDGNISKALDTRSAKSLEWLFDFSAADSGTILVEYLDTLGNQ